MTITDIFSKRGKPLPSVLDYDLPNPLRVQILGIVDEALAPALNRRQLYGNLVYRLAHELGQFSLTSDGGDPQAQVAVFVGREHPPQVLSLLDTLFSLLLSDESGALFASAVEAEEELNHRFREHGVGYRIEGFKVVRIGSEHLHDEVVKPAAAVLHEPHFAGADAEYKKALDHYRHGRSEDTITECHKALESTLKVICDRRGWLPDPEKATASQLIDIAFSEGLVPPYLQSEFAALRTVLGSGVPTIRNRSGGHGAGAKPRAVPESLTAYTLHLTAATILFLAQLEKGR